MRIVYSMTDGMAGNLRFVPNDYVLQSGEIEHAPGDVLPDVETLHSAEYTAEKERLSYREKRAAEYPDFRDYLDARVKQADPARAAEGLAQEQAYLAACLAVKAKYPKP